MITQPESNIKLTDEHLASIQEGENRLSNIDSLLSIANRNLKIAKLDLERTTKDILLGQEQLTALTSQIEVAKTKYQDLSDMYDDGKRSLEVVKNESLEISARHSDKGVELADRESVIVQKEQELAKQTTALNSSVDNHESNKSNFNAKVAKLKEVISTF